MFLRSWCFLAIIIPGFAYAQKVTTEAKSFFGDWDGVFGILLQVAITVAFVGGLALLPYKQHRSKAISLLLGVLGVAVVIGMTTDYFSWISEALSSLTGGGKASDVINNMGSGSK